MLTELGGADEDNFQFFGSKLRQYNFHGYVTSYDEVAFLESLLNETGSINFTSEVGLLGAPTPAHFHPTYFQSPDFLTTGSVANPLINNVQVFYRDLTWNDIGIKPGQREFTLETIEIIT